MKSKIIIYPTDTVWGIGGNAYERDVYLEIASIKGTSPSKPLSLLFNNINQLSEHLELTDEIIDLFSDIRRLGVTIGVSKNAFLKTLPEAPFSETDFVCIRLVENAVTRDLEKIVEFPIISTSLNKTGHEPITEIEEAKDFWQKYCPDTLFIEPDERVALSGFSSTIIIISANEYKIVRRGSALEEIIEKLEKYGFCGRL